jgi:hypothetical protein
VCRSLDYLWFFSHKWLGLVGYVGEAFSFTLGRSVCLSRELWFLRPCPLGIGNTVSSWEPNVIFLSPWKCIICIERASSWSYTFSVSTMNKQNRSSFSSSLFFKWKFELLSWTYCCSVQVIWVFWTKVLGYVNVLKQPFWLTNVPFKCFVNVTHFSCKMITAGKLIHFHLLVISTQMKVLSTLQNGLCYNTHIGLRPVGQVIKGK